MLDPTQREDARWQDGEDVELGSDLLVIRGQFRKGCAALCKGLSAHATRQISALDVIVAGIAVLES